MTQNLSAVTGPAAGAFQWSPVILAAAGIQSPDHAPRRLCRLGRAAWTGRRPTWTISADPRLVGWEKGLWIPAAARMTGVGDKRASGFPLRRELGRWGMLPLASLRDSFCIYDVYLSVVGVVDAGLTPIGSRRDHGQVPKPLVQRPGKSRGLKLFHLASRRPMRLPGFLIIFSIKNDCCRLIWAEIVDSDACVQYHPSQYSGIPLVKDAQVKSNLFTQHKGGGGWRTRKTWLKSLT